MTALVRLDLSFMLHSSPLDAVVLRSSFASVGDPVFFLPYVLLFFVVYSFFGGIHPLVCS